MFNELLKGMDLSVKIENEDGKKAAAGGTFTFKLGIKTITVEDFDKALKRVVDTNIRKAELSRGMSNVIAFVQTQISGEELKNALFPNGDPVRINAISFAQKLIETTSCCNFNVLRGAFETNTMMVQSALISCCFAISTLSELVPILFNNSSEGGSTNE